MGSRKRPTWEGDIDGIHIRVYATRTSYECIAGDEDISDPKSNVWVYPKTGNAGVWAHQFREELKRA